MPVSWLDYELLEARTISHLFSLSWEVKIQYMGRRSWAGKPVQMAQGHRVEGQLGSGQPPTRGET